MGKENNTSTGPGAGASSEAQGAELEQIKDELQLQIDIKKEKLQKLSDDHTAKQVAFDSLQKNTEAKQKEFDQLSEKHEAKQEEFEQLQKKIASAKASQTKAPKPGDVKVQFVMDSFLLRGKTYNSKDVEAAAAKGDKEALAIVAELVKTKRKVVKVTKGGA